MVNTNASSIEVSDVLRTLQSYSIPNEAIGCLVQSLPNSSLEAHSTLPALYASAPCCASQDQKTHLFRATCGFCDCTFSWLTATISPAGSAVCPNVGNFSPVMLVRRYIDCALLALASLCRFSVNIIV